MDRVKWKNCMPTYYPKICEFCNIGFKVLPRAKSQRFCSAKCVRAMNRKAREHINCYQCGKLLNRTQKLFCSKSCSAKLLNKTKIREPTKLNLKTKKQRNVEIVII
jgi:predicted nucleic acid-binding Zn ribbon protein